MESEDDSGYQATLACFGTLDGSTLTSESKLDTIIRRYMVSTCCSSADIVQTASTHLHKWDIYRCYNS